MTDISCGVVYNATLASLVLFRSYCYVAPTFVYDARTLLSKFLVLSALYIEAVLAFFLLLKAFELGANLKTES